MHYFYQLILLGNINTSIAEDLSKEFLDKLDDMNLSSKIVKIIHSNNFDRLYNNKNPSFCFYFGGDDHSCSDIEKLEKLLNNGDAILPIFFNKNKFNKEIPEILHRINGTCFNDTSISKLVNIAFQELRLLRETRKIFISYKRDDSKGVAIQLFDELIKNNFDPFLDYYSIPLTYDFQNELYHRMSDSDVLIQLLTPNFHKSCYCNEEIETANVKQIGVVQVIWPTCNTEKSDCLCIPFKLKEDNLINEESSEECRLSADCLQILIEEIESCRARNLAARQDTLRGEFLQEAKKAGRSIIQDKYYMVEKDKNQKILAVFLPAIGVPTSYDCYKSREFRNLLETPDLRVYLIYDSLKLQKEWIDHLEWLNTSLDVKTIPRKEFDKWMIKN